MTPERPDRNNVPIGTGQAWLFLLGPVGSSGGYRLGGRSGGPGSRFSDIGCGSGLSAPRKDTANGIDAACNPAVHHGPAFSQRLLLDTQNGCQDAEERQEGDNDPDQGIAPGAALGASPYRAVFTTIRHSNRFRKTHTKPPSQLRTPVPQPPCGTNQNLVQV